MKTKKATESLENVGRMVDEMEQRYEKQIDLLKFRVDDACAMAEQYLLENGELKKQLEAREVCRSFTALQLAVSLLVFVYGMVYGAYFGKCR
jgi:hypothetical protein